MPATAERIGFITERYRRVISGPESSVETLYGSKARDNPDPVETFFDDPDDAQVMADERLALLSPSRRMLLPVVQSAQTGLDTDYAPTIPTATVTDDERNYDKAALVVSITMDLERDKTQFQTWG